MLRNTIYYLLLFLNLYFYSHILWHFYRCIIFGPFFGASLGSRFLGSLCSTQYELPLTETSLLHNFPLLLTNSHNGWSVQLLRGAFFNASFIFPHFKAIHSLQLCCVQYVDVMVFGLRHILEEQRWLEQSCDWGQDKSTPVIR